MNTPSAEVYHAEAQSVSAKTDSMFIMSAAVVGGLTLLIAGSSLLLAGATGVAKSLGVSEAAIGLTIVAVGTSLPELTVSVIASIRKQLDVAVGNILGSNIFNLLGILGLSALFNPLSINKRIQQYDQWLMLSASVLLWLFLYTGKRLSRLEGGVLLLGFLGYVWFSFSI